ncbi:low temperature requirement protein A [Micromonospora chaiyaphumensis]|uniref:Low temperature requirement protein LtrA n=1 Tax=Micromonospora chaiyaphumensis TaxID=307119 RepID=A0A1C4VG59_9ACTN|nr:low temperature requirement protein A [Micromonospora chaiyaphumensis]SCE82983.1 Low temperature requirement protein LtrA [Micromonospora chaiyaphumensis]
MPVAETHRATTFEIFFDLVLVFALTRIISFMAEAPTPLGLFQGLLLLLWFWYAWSCYTWLGNLVRADVGVVRAGTTVAMAAIFVAALVIPDAWQHTGGSLDAALALAVAYATVRALHLALFFRAAAGDPRIRRQAAHFAASTTLAWVPLVLGAVYGGTAQVVLWTVAFLVDYGGGRIVTAASLGEVRSAAHFAERHNLVLIIALGESLLSVGAGTGPAVTRAPVLAAALLGFAATVCLWWLYFQRTAPAVGRALAAAPRHTRHRQQLASDAYTLAHLPLIAGISYFALGIHLVLAQLTSDDRPAALGWIPASVLYGGAALYLVGRLLFGWPAAGVPPAPPVVVGLVLVLAPVARALPALVAFGLLTAVLVALAGYERRTSRDPSPVGPEPG